jgi:hypothetical protein
VPFALAALFFLALAWLVDDGYAIYFVPFLVIAALIYVLSPQINWWWYNRNPPDISPELRAYLERCSPFYRRLSAAQQRQFRSRVFLFNLGNDWEPLAFPDDALPPDVQLAISAQAVMLTFGREKFLFDQFEKVIVFPRPFPTPEHPYDHASELHEADGCLLFSAEQVMLAFSQPEKWYNVALHEYTKVMRLQYPNEPWPDFSDENVWVGLEAVSQMPRTFVEAVIGIENTEALPVAIHHYFLFPERFAAIFPTENNALSRIFAM